MSEPNTTHDPMGGPMSRPDVSGVPGIDGGLKQPGGDDAVDPGPQGDGDLGQDTGGFGESEG